MNFRLLALEHLLGTAVLAGLTLLMSIRYPEPAAERHFRLTLLLLALSAVAVAPLFLESPGRLIFLPLGVFLAALLAFLAFVTKTIHQRYLTLRRRRKR